MRMSYCVFQIDEVNGAEFGWCFQVVISYWGFFFNFFFFFWGNLCKLYVYYLKFLLCSNVIYILLWRVIALYLEPNKHIVLGFIGYNNYLFICRFWCMRSCVYQLLFIWDITKKKKLFVSFWGFKWLYHVCNGYLRSFYGRVMWLLVLGLMWLAGFVDWKRWGDWKA